MSHKDTILLTQRESRVLSLMPTGNGDKNISIKELARQTNLTARWVLEIIHELRSKGVPICANRKGLKHQRGYYIATNEDERMDGLASYKSQVADMQELIEAIEQSDLISWQSRVVRLGE